MEVFDKPAVKLLFLTLSYSTLPSSTLQLPSPPPDLAIERKKLISHGTVVPVCLYSCHFGRLYFLMGMHVSVLLFIIQLLIPYSSQIGRSQHHSSDSQGAVLKHSSYDAGLRQSELGDLSESQPHSCVHLTEPISSHIMLLKSSLH